MKCLSSRRKVFSSEDGIILPLVLVFLALGLLLITPALGHGYTALAGSTVTENRAEELHAADSGVEEAIYWITRHQPGEDVYVWDADLERWERQNPYVLNGKSVQVTIKPETGVGEHLYRIVSRAEEPNGAGSTVLAFVFAVPFVSIHELDPDDNPVTSSIYLPEGHVTIDGDLEIATGGTYITTEEITINGDLSITQGNTGIVGDTYVSGNVNLSQGASVSGDVLCVEGNIVLQGGSSINVTQLHMLANDSTITIDNPGNKITGDILASGDLTMDIKSPADLVGNVYSKGDLTITMNGGKITGNLYSQGDMTITINAGGPIEGSLYATGDIRIKINSGDASKNEIESDYICSEGNLFITNTANNITILSTEICSFNNVTIIQEKKSEVSGKLCYGGTYTSSGASNAVFPLPKAPCAEDCCADWPEQPDWPPLLECPGVPLNQAQIWDWEIT